VRDPLASTNRESSAREAPRAQPLGLQRGKGKGPAPVRNEAFVNSGGAVFCSALKMAPRARPITNLGFSGAVLGDFRDSYCCRRAETEEHFASRTVPRCAYGGAGIHSRGACAQPWRVKGGDYSGASTAARSADTPAVAASFSR
jgi:hypothetical protein